VQPCGTSVPCPVAQGDQTIRPWIRAPSVASGLSSFPTTPESRTEGFIAEAQGTCQTTDAVVVSQCVVGGSGPPSKWHSQASSASGPPSRRTPSSSYRSMMEALVLRHFYCSSSTSQRTCSGVRTIVIVTCVLVCMDPLAGSLGAAAAGDDSQLGASAPDEVQHSAAGWELRGKTAHTSQGCG